MSMSAPWVIKFGGSLARGARIVEWLKPLSAAGAVVVPGGGRFADAVREVQSGLQFGDGLAHRLSIRCMEFYGQVLCDLEPTLKGETSLDRIIRGFHHGASSVWLPDPESEWLSALEASWQVTSDSLAVALAKEIGAPRILFVKSVPSSGGQERLADAVALGILDQALPKTHEGSDIQLFRVGPEAPEKLLEGLKDPQACFTQIVPSNQGGA